jgi:hypothetical protein
MPQRRTLVRFRDRYAGLSRMSRWRLRNEEGFPAGVVILKTEFFYEDELEEYEAGRRAKPRTSTAATTDAIDETSA